jgi:site-specific DNA-methyltransferase (adenine-specific)
MTKQLKTVKLKDIVPYENNPRHNDQAVEAVKESIKQCEYIAPIIVDENMVILAGHTRHKALKSLGKKDAEVMIVTGLTEEQKRKYRLLDNKTNELAEWDIDALELELEDLDFEGFDFGFDIEQIEPEPEVEDDDYTEESVETRCKLGDLWQLGNHRLICGDSTDVNVIERLMGGVQADIAFTSPPYNAGTTATETATGKTTKYNGNDDSMSEAEYTDFLNAFIHCAIAFCKYVFMNVQSIAGNKVALIDVLADNKEIYADTIIWDKQNGQPAMAHNVLNSVYEYVHIFSEKANRSIGTIDFRGTIDNILHLPPQRKNEYASVHNATFSVEFASWFISRFAKETVLDSFGGTGTTMIACEQLNKKCFMCELDEHYCDVIIDRWEQFTGKKAVLINE